MKLNHPFLYLPTKKENNTSLIESFGDKKHFVEKVQKALGRKERYIVSSESEETTFTMGIEAAKGALRESNTDISEIDIIIFVSCTPEFVMPSNALKIHSELGGKLSTVCYDLNANSIGGFVALDQISKYLSGSKNSKKGLVICSDKFSNISGSVNPVISFCFSDSSLAFIVEKDESSSGLIDVIYYLDSQHHHKNVYPPKGYSNYKNTDIIQWDSTFDGLSSVKFAKENLEEFLEKNNTKLNDIDLFLFSQFSLKNIELIINHFNLPTDKVPFYSHELGYTSASSPFVALEQYEKNVKKIKKGEKILLWTLGTGILAGLMLWEY